jgi:membrane protease YdiL (CAAX protease family)
MKDVASMSEYNDLFEVKKNEATTVASSTASLNPEEELQSIVDRQKISRLILIVYIAATLLVSAISSTIFQNKYPQPQTIVENLVILETPSVAFYESSDANYPYGIQISGVIQNANSIVLPVLWTDIFLYSEDGILIDTIRLKDTAVSPLGIFAFDETQVYSDPIYSYNFEVGFDESNLFYILFNLASVFLCAAFFLVIDKSGFKNDWKTFQSSAPKHLGMIVLGYLMVFASLYLATTLLEWMGVGMASQNEASIAGMFSPDPFTIILLFLLLCVFTPITEELVYRKVLYGFFERKLGFVVAIVASGAIFGLMHVISYGFTVENLLQSLPYVFMGSAFGFLYHWSKKNIFVMIGIHSINNFVSFLYYFSLVYGITLF